MKQIIPRLWQIDEIGDRVNCYIWEWDHGVTLIDSGFPHDAKTIVAALVKAGNPLHSVRRIIVTHGDVDHTGGLAQVKRATMAPVACHAVEKSYLEHPQGRKPAALWMRLPFLILSRFPRNHIRPVVPEELVVDGQELPEGFVIIHTPGHTPGHISLLHRERRLLIAGDALANRKGKLRAPPAMYTPDVVNARRSIWKLAKRYGDDYDTVVFGHGPPLLSNGGKRIKGLASQIFSTTI